MRRTWLVSMLVLVVILVSAMSLLPGCSPSTPAPAPATTAKPAPTSTAAPAPTSTAAATPKPSPTTTAAATATPTQVLTIRYSAATPATDITPNHMFAVKLKELCDQILPGRVKLQEFPAAQLYNVGDGIKAVQSGAIEIAAADTSAFAPQLGNVDVNRIPGLAKSPAHVFDFWTQYSDEFSKRYLVDKYGMGVKMLYPTDSVVWWFKKPYTSLADIKGRKMGTSPGELLRVLSEGMGMNPAPIDLAERLTAIQTGVVEGSCGTSYTTGYSYTFHKYAPYVYPPSLSPFYGAQLLFYNYKWLNTLPADIKDQFVNVILPRALLEGSYKTQIGYAGKILDLLQKDGGIITDFNKADHDKVLNEIYPACAKILMKLVNQWEVDAIVKVGEKYERGLNWDIKP